MRQILEVGDIMRIGVPKEIKVHEYRVAITPDGVHEAVASGHVVVVETGSGKAVGFPDELYCAAGATIARSATDVFEAADMIVKVKEPQPHECAMLRPGQILFTYLHLAADRPQMKLLMASQCTAIAYETVTDDKGRLPLLAPMSEVAGRMAVQVGAHCLEIAQGGEGILLGGVPGVAPAVITVLGGGVVGTNAARIAFGMGADVTILDRSQTRLAELDGLYGPRLKTVFATAAAVEAHVVAADLVIGAVLSPGAAAPRLVTRAMLKKMHPGAVLVDVSIDQGGCFETSRPTTHAEPTYVIDDIVHYCVANMPGGVARTSTLALTNATLPFILHLASSGWRKAMAEDHNLLRGLNVHGGVIACPGVAAAHNQPLVAAEMMLAG